MGLTQDFFDNPFTFLGDHIVIVQDEQQADPPTKQPLNFFLKALNSAIPGNNYVFLVKCGGANKSDEVIPAYWLPWKKGKANVLTLGDKAQFMFTSELTNCRFSVLTGDMTNPKVAHVEGTTGSGGRDKYEETAGLPARKTDTEKKMRRLSVTGIKHPTRDESGPKHQYSGQDQGLKKTSAFVFGYRATPQTTTWKFYAQIVEGVMGGNNIDSLKTATEKVVPLNQAYEIA